MRLNWGTAPVGAFEVLELCLVLLVVGIAFLRPQLGDDFFTQIENRIRTISRRPWVCLLLLALFPVLLRLFLLPVYGVPEPYVSDEYAYLLQSDTLSSGRLTNPSPPFPEQFESVYVLAAPTYTAEYQIGQSAALAAGQILTGMPWTGVMLSMGVLCGLVYWALLGWLPPAWAFVATATVMDIQLGVLSYWMNSYWGGCVPAIGGALVFGGLPRILHRNRLVYSFVTAAGLIVLFNSRALEGILLALIVISTLLYWTVSKQLSPAALFSRVVPALALSAVLAVSFAGFYNYRVTGKASEFPYALYHREYGLPQGFFWQKPVLVDTEHMPADIRSEYEDQLRQHERRKSWKALAGATGGKLRRFWGFYIGIPLTLTLLFLPFIWRGPRIKIAFWSLVVVLGLENLTFFAYFPHYSAAVTVLIVFVLIACLRQMRFSGPSGLFLSRALPLVSLVGLLLPVGGRLIQGFLPPGMQRVSKLWASEFAHDVARESFTPRLRKEPGPQLVLVRYRPYDGSRKTEWIFNRANLDAAKIIWARESSDPEVNRRLLKRFAGRTVWLAEPDADPASVTPFRASDRH